MKNESHTAAQRERPRIAPNQSAAAKVLGVERKVVKSAKAKGCPAFRANGSVEIEGLEKWLLASIGKSDANDPDEWSFRLHRAKALREEKRLAEDEKRLMPVDVVDEVLTRIVGVSLCNAFQRLLENELPPLTQGLPADKIRAINAREGKKLINAVKDDIDRFTRTRSLS
ncbi:MAG: hypothetical protein ABQ298_03650 [Puniceicoccaceae bacterium]